MLVVLPATLPDIRAIYDVWFAAFKDTLILKLLYPNTDVNSDDFRKAHAEGTLQYWKGLSMEHTFKCVDTETGRIVGLATWQVYWRERTAEERQKPWIGWLEGEDRRRIEDFLGGLWEARERYIGEKKHVYCHTVAVHPEFQGRGVGKLLMQWGIDMSRQLQVPVYLESTLEGLPLYEKLGFQRLPKGVEFSPEVTRLPEPIEAPLMVRMLGDGDFLAWAGVPNP